MDPRQYQQRARPQQLQEQDSKQHQRFSWQEPTDPDLGANQQRNQAQRAGNSQVGAPRQSWMDTPIEMRAGHQNWPSARQPSEPPIPQSPSSPASSPSPPITSPEKPPINPESNPYQNIQAPTSTHPALASDHTTPLSSGHITPAASYAVLPQTPNAPLPAQSPPLTLQTGRQSSQSPLSPGSMAPIPYGASPDHQQPGTATTAINTIPYTPYSNLQHQNPTSPDGTVHSATTFHTPNTSHPDKSRPFAPDDLIYTRNEAAAQVAAQQEGRGRADTTTTAVFTPATPNPAPHQPGQILHPNMKLRPPGSKEPWSHSLFACAPDTDTCCLGLFCPCIVHSRTAYRMDARSNVRDPTDLLGFSSTNAQCMLMAVVGCVGCLFPMVMRARIRHLYKLEGGIGGDAVTACCCCCCSVVQNEREVKGREEGRRRFAGPGAGEGYRATTGEMRYVAGGA
ncbi:PLAC8-domain-containing protein [Rhizodiscina lignyota]|uniref:PLAC8-domain-containing protein n=1 Tax=Rhizodiscina lignyota TaxID=1504668 RepID=A0A9P4ME16_9PEZI|nr:PLAC8-domain-containing protein [Rhizodiscina lignyota]